MWRHSGTRCTTAATSSNSSGARWNAHRSSRRPEKRRRPIAGGCFFVGRHGSLPGPPGDRGESFGPIPLRGGNRESRAPSSFPRSRFQSSRIFRLFDPGNRRQGIPSDRRDLPHRSSASRQDIIITASMLDCFGSANQKANGRITIIIRQPPPWIFPAIREKG
jgi:hypothetical protein